MKKVSLEWGVNTRCFLCCVFLLQVKTHWDDLIIVQQYAVGTDTPENATDFVALQFLTFKQG